MKKELGGQRLGSGNKMNVHLHNYGRSSHNLGKIVRTSMGPGTLVPFFTEIGLNGDTFDIDLTTKVRTLPTTGPIFGQFKQQLDVFVYPIRLANAALHNNMLGIGMDMAKIKLPMMEITGNGLDLTKDSLNSQQVNQASLLAYLGVRGLGRINNGTKRQFQAVPLLAYWDIYKNYYANKQEEIGVVITTDTKTYTNARLFSVVGSTETTIEAWGGANLLVKTEHIIPKASTSGTYYRFSITTAVTDRNEITIPRKDPATGEISYQAITIANGWRSYASGATITVEYQGGTDWIMPAGVNAVKFAYDETLKLANFPLKNIDDMRMAILAAPMTSPYVIGANAAMPYVATTGTITDNGVVKSKSFLNQGGLGVKTYMSDRFNNWLSTEWIDGPGGIQEVTAVDVSEGTLNLDTLNLAQKVYNMLNRIAVSGGSYNDWQEAVWGEETARMAESPMYMGGMSALISFDEVVSTADATAAAGENMPLGTLAGRGADRAHKGGKAIHIKIKEPSIIMGIISITPLIDYSQGNRWYTRLKTMNDFHKPALDAIGFQELITEEMAAFDTTVDVNGKPTYKSAGKQPAWIEYMTNVNETFGTFANENETMFMTLNRKYAHDATGNIKDITTYIDPTKYNYAFADARLDAQNFWMQIGIDMIARRKMSAKVIPNL